jgi:hypothetical protein
VTLGETNSRHAEKYASVITVKKMSNIITPPPLNAEMLVQSSPAREAAPETSCPHKTSPHESRPAICVLNLRSGNMLRRGGTLKGGDNR